MKNQKRIVLDRPNGLKIEYGFSLVEILIVVSIIGILAAIVIPEFQNHSLQATETATKDNLSILRKAIELYAMQHNGVAPGYPGNVASDTPTESDFISQLLDSHAIHQFPENSFNGLSTVQVLANGAPFPAAADDSTGWIYQPQTRNIRINHAGADAAGTSYINY